MDQTQAFGTVLTSGEIWAQIHEMEAEIGIEREGRIFSPCSDFVFKAMLSQDSAESEIARLGFLSSILGTEVTSATVAQNELAVMDMNEKNSTMDLHVKLQNGEEANVEIQLEKNGNIINRSEYYTCKLFGS
jgi:hypothetical protein